MLPRPRHRRLVRQAVLTGVMLVGVTVLRSERLAAQPVPTSACRSERDPVRSSDHKDEWHRFLESVRTAVDPEVPGFSDALRQSLRLPRVPRANLRLVADSALCARAAAAYHAYLDGDDESFSGRVFMVRVRDRYVVLDPEYFVVRPGIQAQLVFDATFQVIGQW